MPRSGDPEDGDPERVARSELVGLHVEVAASDHDPYVGLTGTVVDETRNTLVVRTDDGDRTVPKRGQRFTFTTRDGSTATLDGSRIEARPADRIKDR